MCVCVCVSACVRACVCVCVRERETETERETERETETDRDRQTDKQTDRQTDIETQREGITECLSVWDENIHKHQHRDPTYKNPMYVNIYVFITVKRLKFITTKTQRDTGGKLYL